MQNPFMLGCWSKIAKSIHNKIATNPSLHFLCARSWVQMLEQEGKIAKFVPVDFTDAETVFERSMQVCVCVCLSAHLLTTCHSQPY